MYTCNVDINNMLCMMIKIEITNVEYKWSIIW